MKASKSVWIWLRIPSRWICVGLLILTALSCSREPKSVNMLAWIGYDEADLLADFKNTTGISVNVQTFIGGAAMLDKLRHAPNAFDVVVLDPEYISLAVREGLLQPLDERDYELSTYPPVFKDMSVCKVGGVTYAIPVRYGTIGLMYNADRVNPSEIASYQDLFSPRFKGRLCTFDLWQPIMGTMALLVGPASERPYQLSEDEMAGMTENLERLRSNGLEVFREVGPMVSALADESLWIMVGGGEANIPALEARGKNFRSLIPKEGGILWTESLGLAANARNRKNAIALIQYLQSPAGQVKLARRAMYISTPTSSTGVNMLSEAERALRNVESSEAMDRLLASVRIRELPESGQDQWIEIWDHVKRIEPER